MARPLLHFAHATGVPSASYQHFFDALDADVLTLPLISHEEAYPVGQEWDALVQQLCNSIRAQAGRPVIGVGHSLGGALHFMAAQRHPELYRGLVLMEPAMVNRRSVLVMVMLHLTLAFGLSKEPPLFRLRRDSWSSRAEAEKSLGSKKLYQRFDERCRQDFFRHGLVDREDGSVRLRFSAENERLIYRTAPRWHHWRFRRPSKVPGVLLHGKDSDLVQSGAGQWLQQQHGFQALACDGGHFFPLERPVETARKVMQGIKLIESAGSGILFPADARTTE